MKSLIVLFIFSFAIFAAQAQSKTSKNAVFLEAFGNGMFGSLNYERQLTKKPELMLRAGVGFYSENAFYLTIPVSLTYLIKLKNASSFVELGAGITWARINGNLFGKENGTNGDHYVNFVPSVGYRHYTKTDMMWRISFCPVINKYAFTPWGGISIGKRL